VICVNTSFRYVPWADLLYACDKPWWKVYLSEVNSTFGAGERWSASVRASADYGLRHIPSRETHKRWGDGCISRGLNSGHQALSLAALFGAARVVLLGYDFQKTAGLKHCHPDHPQPLGNLGSIDKWVLQMGELAEDLAARGVQVVNATRQTALRCFPRVTLEEALA
jgi:hypothetical protein